MPLIPPHSLGTAMWFALANVTKVHVTQQTCKSSCKSGLVILWLIGTPANTTVWTSPGSPASDNDRHVAQSPVAPQQPANTWSQTSSNYQRLQMYKWTGKEQPNFVLLSPVQVFQHICVICYEWHRWLFRPTRFGCCVLLQQLKEISTNKYSASVTKPKIQGINFGIGGWWRLERMQRNCYGWKMVSTLLTGVMKVIRKLICMCGCASHLVISNFLWPHGPYSARLHCPWILQ